jgi:hypothetical protein
VVNNIHQVGTRWCQKEQIQIVLLKVDSGTDLNFRDHDIQSIQVCPTTVPNKVNHALPLLGLLHLVTELFGSCESYLHHISQSLFYLISPLDPITVILVRENDLSCLVAQKDADDRSQAS